MPHSTASIYDFCSLRFGYLKCFAQFQSIAALSRPWQRPQPRTSFPTLPPKPFFLLLRLSSTASKVTDLFLHIVTSRRTRQWVWQPKHHSESTRSNAQNRTNVLCTKRRHAVCDESNGSLGCQYGGCLLVTRMASPEVVLSTTSPACWCFVTFMRNKENCGRT